MGRQLASGEKGKLKKQKTGLEIEKENLSKADPFSQFWLTEAIEILVQLQTGELGSGWNPTLRVNDSLAASEKAKVSTYIILVNGEGSAGGTWAMVHARVQLTSCHHLFCDVALGLKELLHWYYSLCFDDVQSS